MIHAALRRCNALPSIFPANGGGITLQFQTVPMHRQFSTAIQQQHWIDKMFPGVRDWLEAKNREFWFRGLEERCRRHHLLQGREIFLRTAVESEYQHVYNRHTHQIVDSRSKQHLSVAALAVASHKVLLSFIRDEIEVLKMINDHMGAHTAPALIFLMRMASWLQRDPYASLVSRLRGLKLDYGLGFASTLHIVDQPHHQASLTIAKCFYREIFEEENVVQLARCCCCSVDRVWLEGAKLNHVFAGLVDSMASGDKKCCFVVKKIEN